jgi:holliday junction DNA helicase RuvB
MFFNRSKISLLFSPSVRREDRLFDKVYGHDDTKKLFKMALESSHTCSILLMGPPASAKTLFLQSLMKLKDSYLIDCSNATKSGIVDYVFEHKPKYLLLDELDKLSRKDQTFLLNLMETGLVLETKYHKTRRTETKTSVYATSNNVQSIIAPLQSRFFIVRLEPYTLNSFLESQYDFLLQIITMWIKK